ncbi:hypothetical protein RRG08_065218 [Elysia crispata]|uniref:Uncharacterized protein n=1 Tax=Elysia crispata TaxID=231223 RepID=A0AAE1CYX5_9GAST|nr:hypothetical protein RRG08_065218 [Elysia crispata]
MNEKRASREDAKLAGEKRDKKPELKQKVRGMCKGTLFISILEVFSEPSKHFPPPVTAVSKKSVAVGLMFSEEADGLERQGQILEGEKGLKIPAAKGHKKQPGRDFLAHYLPAKQGSETHHFQRVLKHGHVYGWRK